ncbi:MAG: mannose-1-phosphate guanylyltransferase [Fimbriimonas sp.]
MKKRVAIVMAGGSGERFWPLSRPGRPKQLLRLTDPDATMLEEAVNRVLPSFGKDGVYVATSTPLREPIVASGVVDEARVLTEPARRNTLGALAWIVATLVAQGLEDAVVAILTADHLIGDPERFRGCVEAAMDVAEDHGGIVTLGIPPTRPETGYGYIEEGDEEIATRGGRTARRSTSFREKPSPQTAEEFVAAGRFLWNGGMFFFTVQNFLAELAHAQPDAHRATRATAEALGRGDHAEAVRHFEQLPNLSVDYAVMERAERVYVLRTDFPWDDVGAWDAMERTLPRDGDGNVVQGNAVVLESKGSIVINDDASILVGAIGLHDLVVVATKDSILVCPKEQAQRVRLITQALAARDAV